MKKQKKPIICVTCDKGKLKPGKIREESLGIYLGDFPGLICTKCGETYLDQDQMEKVEKIAKAKGIWGLGKKTSISKSGNSLAARIPKNIAQFLNWKEGREVWIHPEKDKLVIEPID